MRHEENNKDRIFPHIFTGIVASRKLESEICVTR